MNPAYSYTADDQINPVYCIGCREHIPNAISNAGRGLCPVCLGKINAAAPSQTAPAQTTPPPQVPAHMRPTSGPAPYASPPGPFAGPAYPPPGYLNSVPPSLATPPRQTWYQGIFGIRRPAHSAPGQFGPCPHCHGLYVNEWANFENNGAAVGLRSAGAVITLLGIVTICFGGFFFIPIGLILWIIGACIPTRRIVSTSRGCQSCGYRWQV